MRDQAAAALWIALVGAADAAATYTMMTAGLTALALAAAAAAIVGLVGIGRRLALELP